MTDASLKQCMPTRIFGVHRKRRAMQFRQWAAFVLRQFAIRGHVTAEYAKEYAETEFEKYRIIQNRLFSSDFDKLNSEENLPES